MTTPKTVPVAAVVRALRKAERDWYMSTLYSQGRSDGLSQAVDIIRSVAARAGRKRKGTRK